MAHHKEGKIETYFCEQVELHGGLVRKSQWVGRRGCPDRFWAFPVKDWDLPETRAVTDGPYREECSGFAEIKAPGCKPDAHQQREIARLRASGVTVWVIDSLEKVNEFIQWVGR